MAPDERRRQGGDGGVPGEEEDNVILQKHQGADEEEYDDDDDLAAVFDGNWQDDEDDEDEEFDGEVDEHPDGAGRPQTAFLPGPPRTSPPQLRRRVDAQDPPPPRRRAAPPPPPPPPGGLRGALYRLWLMHENGILVQGLGIPLRHFLALWGFSLLVRGHVSKWTVLFSIFLWIVSGLGVTAGAHRLWTHQSYVATPAMETLLMLMFSMADQGPIRGWCLTHAMHHCASDTENDPHNRQEGWWHAHFGWLYAVRKFCLSAKEHDRVLSGLGPAVHFHDERFLWWDPLWSHVVPGLVAWLWGEPLNGFLVAGAFRWCCVQHITFFVNSVAHGERHPGDEHLFDTTADGIGPRVSLLTTLLALGEGWHDYHHLFPWDYAAAELDAWDQWNPTKVFIDACNSAGIASGRRRCSRMLQEARRRQLLDRAEGLPVPCAGKAAASCGFRTEGPLFFRHRVAVELSPSEAAGKKSL